MKKKIKKEKQVNAKIARKPPRKKKHRFHSHNLWKRFVTFLNEDPFLKGTILIVSATLLFIVFIFNNVPGLSTVYAYTFGLFFGEFAPLIYFWIFYRGVISMFKPTIAKWRFAKNNRFWKHYRQINLTNYSLIAIAVILLVVFIQSVQIEAQFLNRVGQGDFYFAQWTNSFTNANLGTPVLPYYYNYGFLVHLVYLTISVIYNHYLILFIFIIYLLVLVPWFSRSLILKVLKDKKIERTLMKINKFKKKTKYEKLVPASKNTISLLSFGTTKARLVEQLDAESYTNRIRLEEENKRAQKLSSTLEMVNENAQDKFPLEAKKMSKRKGKSIEIVGAALSHDLKTGKVTQTKPIFSFKRKKASAIEENLDSEFDVLPAAEKKQEQNFVFAKASKEDDDFDVKPPLSASNDEEELTFIPTVQVDLPSQDALEIQNNKFTKKADDYPTINEKTSFPTDGNNAQDLSEEFTLEEDSNLLDIPFDDDKDFDLEDTDENTNLVNPLKSESEEEAQKELVNELEKVPHRDTKSSINKEFLSLEENFYNDENVNYENTYKEVKEELSEEHKRIENYTPAIHQKESSNAPQKDTTFTTDDLLFEDVSIQNSDTRETTDKFSLDQSIEFDLDDSDDLTLNTNLENLTEETALQKDEESNPFSITDDLDLDD